VTAYNIGKPSTLINFLGEDTEAALDGLPSRTPDGASSPEEMRGANQ